MVQSIFGTNPSYSKQNLAEEQILVPTSITRKVTNPRQTIEYMMKTIEILSDLAANGSKKKKSALERLVVLENLIQARIAELKKAV